MGPGARREQARPAALGRLRALAIVSSLLSIGGLAAGCYAGAAHDVSPGVVAGEPGWTMVRGVPFVHQERQKDCGAAALAMVLSYWSIPTGPSQIAAVDPASDRDGLRAGQLRDWARGHG